MLLLLARRSCRQAVVTVAAVVPIIAAPRPTRSRSRSRSQSPTDVERLLLRHVEEVLRSVPDDVEMELIRNVASRRRVRLARCTPPVFRAAAPASSTSLSGRRVAWRRLRSTACA